MRRIVKLELQPNFREGAVARRVASAMLKDDHANAQEVADVELVTSELVTNAVAASTGSDAVKFSMEAASSAGVVMDGGKCGRESRCDLALWSGGYERGVVPIRPPSPSRPPKNTASTD